MADNYEAAVEQYLTIDGEVFLAPQYEIAFDDLAHEGGSCPDFVALDWRHRHVVVVEVSSAANLRTLIERVRDREKRWYNPVRQTLKTLSVISTRIGEFVSSDLFAMRTCRA
jgi:hypothetical protein